MKIIADDFGVTFKDLVSHEQGNDDANNLMNGRGCKGNQSGDVQCLLNASGAVMQPVNDLLEKDAIAEHFGKRSNNKRQEQCKNGIDNKPDGIKGVGWVFFS